MNINAGTISLAMGVCVVAVTWCFIVKQMCSKTERNCNVSDYVYRRFDHDEVYSNRSSNINSNSNKNNTRNKKKKKEFVYLSPKKIRYTQDSIASTFGDKTKHGQQGINDTLNELNNGLEKRNIPMIRVVKHNGDWYSLDNRRLYMFKQLNAKTIKCKIHYDEIPRGRKWGGYDIKVRNGGIS